MQHRKPDREHSTMSRRHFLGLCAGAASGLIIRPAEASITKAASRDLSFHNLHTGERLSLTYWEGGDYVDDALRAVNHVLRDHRTGEVHAMDPGLLDLLVRIRSKLDTDRPFEVISGYRSPKTNAKLRKASGGVAKRSLHMSGKAIDIRVPGRDVHQLQKAALSLKAGGVGLYTKSRFVHVDTGRVRSW
ncbi:MAG: DUF882 domain-containing protein [Chromatiales bacterium]|jgi:uncharacterized protein YcbK (DUF882 family)